ncbi:MAG: FAD:protein FMN transferase, partial [Verrucomicrobiia bacterium]
MRSSDCKTDGLSRLCCCHGDIVEVPKIQTLFNGCSKTLRLGFFVLALVNGQLEAGDIVEFHGQTMGTTYSVKIAHARLTQETIGSIQTRIEERLKEINRQMSHYQPDSELSLFNRSPGTEPVRVSRELAEVVRFALVLHQKSAGAFDPTLGPLVEIWGFAAKGTVLEPPTPESIA